MSKVLVTESYLAQIANAIRAKLGVATTYKPSQMPAAITSIPTGTTPTGTVNITQNGTTDVTQYASANVQVPNSYAAGDEGKVVSNGALVAQTAHAEVTQNGTIDTTLNNSVTVNVSGGGGTLSWRDTFSVNWDFSNPVNTRGNTTYSAGSTTGQVFTIDGWHIYGGIVELVTGGLKLTRYSAGSAGYFMQRYQNTATAAMVGREFTLSCIVDGVLAYRTANMPSANAGTAGTSANGVYFRIWNYGQQVAVTIDVGEDTGSHVVQAIKLEAGATQTLATQVNGVWVLNNSMDANTEYVKARNGIVTNS